MAMLFLFVTFLLTQYDRLRAFNGELEYWIQSKYAGTLHEGDQYRIFMPYAAHWIEVHASIKPAQSVPIIEAISFGLAMVLLYLQFSWSQQMESASPARRLTSLGLFLAALQLPMLWIYPWERPETLPTAFYVALIALLGLHYEWISLPVSLVIAAALSPMQASMRGDAPVIMGGGLVLFALIARDLPGTRRIGMASIGVTTAALGGVTQLYLEHLFPLHPGQTKATFQLWTNLRVWQSPFHIPVFLTAISPLVFTLWLVWRNRLKLDTSSRLILFLCVLYLPIYFCLGLVQEVRIYVPYMMLAAPSLGKVWASYLLGGADAEAAGSV